MMLAYQRKRKRLMPNERADSSLKLSKFKRLAKSRQKSAVKIGDDFSYRTDFLQNSLKQTEGLSLQGLLIALAFGERAWLDNKTLANFHEKDIIKIKKTLTSEKEVFYD